VAIFQQMGGEGVAAADRFADAVEEPWRWRPGLIGLADGERRDIRDVHYCRIPHRAGQLKGDHAGVPPPVGYHDNPSVRTRQYGISRHRVARACPRGRARPRLRDARPGARPRGSGGRRGAGGRAARPRRGRGEWRPRRSSPSRGRSRRTCAQRLRENRGPVNPPPRLGFSPTMDHRLAAPAFHCEPRLRRGLRRGGIGGIFRDPPDDLRA